MTGQASIVLRVIESNLPTFRPSNAYFFFFFFFTWLLRLSFLQFFFSFSWFLSGTDSLSLWWFTSSSCFLMKILQIRFSFNRFINLILSFLLFLIYKLDSGFSSFLENFFLALAQVSRFYFQSINSSDRYFQQLTKISWSLFISGTENSPRESTAFYIPLLVFSPG